MTETLLVSVQTVMVMNHELEEKKKDNKFKKYDFAAICWKEGVTQLPIVQ